jgi:hypothetical protein
VSDAAHESAPPQRTGGITFGLAVALAGASAAPLIAQGPWFNEESWARGIQYTMRGPWGALTEGSAGFGTAIADLDGDGDPDLALVGRSNGLPGVFENDGTGHFSNRSFSTGILPLAKASVVLAFDYDGDRDLDLFFGQWAEPDRLYRNDGGFQFTDVTGASGLGSSRRAAGASVVDFDGDGWLDLYVCVYHDPTGGDDSRNLLYRNRGDGTFEEVAAVMGVDSPQPSLQSAMFDFDGDSWPDLFVANDRGNASQTNRLWRNVQGGFVDVTADTGTGIGMCSMSAGIGDPDGDVRPDIHVTNAPSNVPPMDGSNLLLLQEVPGQFVRSEDAWAVTHDRMSWGSTFWDFDNDGDEDLYVVSEDEGNSLYLNSGGAPMVDIGATSGLAGNDGDAFTVSHGDLDLDGDLDVVLNNLSHPVELFINEVGEDRRWIRLRIAGEHPNWHAVGATAIVRQGGRKQVRSQWRQVLVGGNGYLAQHETILHFGLGDAAMADEIEVVWPCDGGQRSLTGLPADQVWTILPESRLGDLDGDGDVDLADRELLGAWIDAPLVPGREAADLDGDADVDRIDLALLWARAGWVRSDLDGDGIVGGADLAILLGSWGSDDAIADVDGDGSVAGSDLASMLGQWSSIK